MHDAGYVHGDLKPRNFVRHQNEWALINLHASAKIGGLASWSKSSSAYLPPEAITFVNDAPRVREVQVTDCQCGARFAQVPSIDRVCIIHNKVSLKFCDKHPFSVGQVVRLNGFLPEKTSTGKDINTAKIAYRISECTDDCINFFICDDLNFPGEYDCEHIGVVSFGCLGLCGLAHVAHDMWALGVLIFR